jgi:hypothetical protein
MAENLLEKNRPLHRIFVREADFRFPPAKHKRPAPGPGNGFYGPAGRRPRFWTTPRFFG